MRLGEHFNLVGGTSTGAIIAGALALGFSAAQVKHFYTALAPLVFKRQPWAIPGLQAKFGAHSLRAEILKIVGDREMQSEDLITGLCVVAKRIDTGSPWIVANNPKSPFWEDGGKGADAYDGNKHYKLATLVRASTAAPSYFDPELLPITGRDAPLPPSAAKPMEAPVESFVRSVLAFLGLKKKVVPDPKSYGLFVDGGVTPHNNPSFALLQMISLKAFQLCWKSGPENLSFVSIGTGTFRPKIKYEDLGFTRYLQLALHSLMSMMSDAQTLVLAQMQWLGECPAPWKINSEIGTLAHDGPPNGKLFRFLRYDVILEPEWLAQELGLDVSEKECNRLRQMDNPGIVNCIYGIARLAAEKQVKAEHFFPKPKTSGDAAAAPASANAPV